MSGYEVVPAALTGMAGGLTAASDSCTELQETMGRWTMDGLALGVLGELAEYPKTYNDALQDVIETIGELSDNLDDAATEVRASADVYADKEASWYEQFGYTID